MRLSTLASNDQTPQGLQCKSTRQWFSLTDTPLDIMFDKTVDQPQQGHAGQCSGWRPCVSSAKQKLHDSCSAASGPEHPG
jgi:hypothetical protein